MPLLVIGGTASSSRELIRGKGAMKHPWSDVSGNLDDSAWHGNGIEWLAAGRMV